MWCMGFRKGGIMSAREIHNKEVTARKDHPEMMSDWFRHENLHELCHLGLSFSEWRAILNLRDNYWMIKKGQKCNCFVGIDCDGNIYRAYYLKEIDAIVRKYDLIEYYC